MTNAQKQSILDMRKRGIGYSKIADLIGVSVNTIKSYCRRNNPVVCNDSEDACSLAESDGDEKNYCKQCGKNLEQIPKSKPKTFCNDKCRFAWWNANRASKDSKSMLHITCLCCGVIFQSYSNSNRKFCSHPCYIKSRFTQGSDVGEGSIKCQTNP